MEKNQIEAIKAGAMETKSIFKSKKLQPDKRLD
jgi:hypothetical protein